jgi:short-subunit dehydrogenase
MRHQGSGLLIHISSGAGRLAIPGQGFYSASKFALEALAEAYRYELASQGIDSVIVEPGAYVTAISEQRAYTAEESRACAYGPANEIPKRLFCGAQLLEGEPASGGGCGR